MVASQKNLLPPDIRAWFDTLKPGDLYLMKLETHYNCRLNHGFSCDCSIDGDRESLLLVLATDGYNITFITKDLEIRTYDYGVYDLLCYVS